MWEGTSLGALGLDCYGSDVRGQYACGSFLLRWKYDWRRKEQPRLLNVATTSILRFLSSLLSSSPRSSSENAQGPLRHDRTFLQHSRQIHGTFFSIKIASNFPDPAYEICAWTHDTPRCVSRSSDERRSASTIPIRNRLQETPSILPQHSFYPP